MLRNWFLLIVLILFINSCVTVQRQRDMSFYTENTWNGQINPRLIEGELSVTIKNIKLLSGDLLVQDNISREIPASQKPTLLLWSPKIINRANQTQVQNLLTRPQPDQEFNDLQNGNVILFWNLSDSIVHTDSIRIVRRFQYLTFDYRPLILPESGDAWPDLFSEPGLERYLASEMFLEQSAELKELALNITSDYPGYPAKVRALHQYVNQKMSYMYPPAKRGAQAAFETLAGDCGQYSALFIALCRAIKVPARQQSGFNFTQAKISYHVWSEVYFPESGWIPVDATRKDGFGYLDNGRLIASVGMNIELPLAPSWANYKNTEVQQGKTDFMQLVTIVKSGFDADISTERVVLRDEQM